MGPIENITPGMVIHTKPCDCTEFVWSVSAAEAMRRYANHPINVHVLPPEEEEG
jgi:hypothetical protein